MGASSQTTTPEYWTRIRARAKELGSDGCTKAKDWHVECCYEHDIHWRTGKTLDGDPITTAEANARFRECIQNRSRLGRFSHMSWVRWVGVSIGALFMKHESK